MRLYPAMQQISARVSTIPKLNCYDFPALEVQTPAFVMSLPQFINPNSTYARGMDTMDIPGYISVSTADMRSAVRNLSEYCDGSGDRSIIQVVQSGTYTAFDSIVVTRIEFEFEPRSDSKLLTASFTFSVSGKGKTE